MANDVAAPINLTNKIVLVVDDEKFSRNIITRVLASFNTIDVGDGQSAINSLSMGTNIGLIICDFNMPGINGIQVLKKVRTDPDRKRQCMPFLMLTGTSDVSLVKLALQLDVDGFLVKPVSKFMLDERIHHMLSQSREIKSPEYYAAINIDTVCEKLLGPTAPVSSIEDLLPSKSTDQEIPSGAILTALSAMPPNAVVAVDIKAPTGELLVGKGVTLSNRMIQRLQDLVPLNIVPPEIWVFVN